MKLHLFFTACFSAALLPACGGGGGGSAGDGNNNRKAFTYTFTSKSTPSVVFTNASPGSATVAASENFRITNGFFELGTRSETPISGTCELRLVRLGVNEFEANLSAAPCVKTIVFSKGGVLSGMTVTAK